MSKKVIKFLTVFLVIICLLSVFTGCTEADNVNFNLSSKADNFEVCRKITVYNARTDLIVLEIEGYMSISNNSNSELVVTCKVDDDEYKKNYVYLNEYVIYVVEDITGTVTDPYHYEIHFYTALPDININR